MSTGLNELDIIFGRAILAFRLVSRTQLDECLSIQKQLRATGQNKTLAQVVVQKGLLDRDQYQKVVSEIRKRMASGAAPTKNQATTPVNELPPDITASGRYQALKLPGQSGWKPSAGGPQLANAPWGSSDVIPGADPNALTMPLAVPNLPTNAQAAPPAPIPPAALASTPSAPDRVPSSGGVSSNEGSRGDWELMSESEAVPPDLPILKRKKKKKRRDAHIRKLLEIPENVEQFPIGNYQVLEIAGAGGMGVIYRAQNKAGEIHALKALMNVEKASEKQISRFNAEGKLMSRLRHPNIVQVYEMDVFKGVPYFTMDFLKGEDFHDILKAHSKTIRDCVGILRDIAQAVSYAHDNGVVHRDLKPSNIFVCEDGNPVLTDFGLAKNLESEYKQTKEGSIVGTPLYLSPEQVSGQAHEADGRVDVYGLGVILYQIVAGRLPFLGKNPYDVYKKILAEDPKSVVELNPKLDKDIEKIVFTAIAKRPEERFQSAQELADDLTRWLDGEKVKCTPPPPGRRYRKKKRKPKPQAQPTAAGAGDNVRGSDPTPTPRPKKRRTKAEKKKIVLAFFGGLILITIAIIASIVIFVNR